MKHSILEFCPGNFGAIEHQKSETYNGIGVQKPQGQTKIFDLNFGDALIFGDHAVHRTYCPEGATNERRSLEFRLTRPEHALKGKDYFDVASSRWVNP